jgi:hypothetical protein
MPVAIHPRSGHPAAEAKEEIMLLLALLLGCPPPIEDTTGDTGASVPDLTDLAGARACFHYLLASNAEATVILQIPDMDMVAIAMSGKPAEAAGEAGTSPDLYALLWRGIWPDETWCEAEAGFPPALADGGWVASSGSIDATFTPSQAWPSGGSWVNDGTVIGTVSIIATDLVFDRTEAESGSATLGAVTLEAPYDTPDPPA